MTAARQRERRWQRRQERRDIRLGPFRQALVTTDEPAAGAFPALGKLVAYLRAQGKRGKAAWSRLEEVLADRKLEKDLRDVFDDEDV